MSAQNAVIAAKGVSEAMEAESEKLPVEVATGSADEAVAEAAEKSAADGRNQSKAKSNKGRNKSKKKRKY